MKVHCVALENKQGAHLAVHGGKDYARGPYGEQPDNGFELFDLRHCAQSPSIHRAFDSIRLSLHSGLVKETEQRKNDNNHHAKKKSVYR